MAALFEKKVRAKIDYMDVWNGYSEHREGVADWIFELHNDSPAFQYGNQTYVVYRRCTCVNNHQSNDTGAYDTRYITGITEEKGFEEFCLDTVEQYYGTNAKEVKLV